MTTQYDTEYLNSLSILELQKLKALIALTLINRDGNNEEYEKLFKEAITELAKSVGLGVRFS